LVIVNDVLVDNIRKRLETDDHVTLSLLRYTRNGILMFAGAHEEMILCRARTRSVERIPTPGTWLGARKGIGQFLRDSMIVLKDGDLLVLYTDGVTEAMNATNEQFDIDRLCKVVEKHQDESPAEVRDAILDAVHAFMKKQFDDISLVVIRYKE
jgi:sigma-B regulation protein RsbU (phosphoserine phosphatase)